MCSCELIILISMHKLPLLTIFEVRKILNHFLFYTAFMGENSRPETLEMEMTSLSLGFTRYIKQIEKATMFASLYLFIETVR